jgi:hypothetical protein
MYNVPNTLMPNTFMAVAADLAEGYSPVLNMVQGCVHYGNKQDVGTRLALAVRSAVYGDSDVVATGPMVASVATSANTVIVQFGPKAALPLEVRNVSGFEVSANGVDYYGAEITAHTDNTVTLTTPTAALLRSIRSDAIRSKIGADAGGTSSSGVSAGGGIGGGVDDDGIPLVASIRYILHDTPCINKTCGVYGQTSGLPSPPLIANLPGHVRVVHFVMHDAVLFPRLLLERSQHA